ncbi:MAG: (d)CMP kinase [Myxococcales bacterium]
MTGSKTRSSGQPVIAIDGPAGAGKSTAARQLAQRLGFVLVDTGALYRGVALAAFERGVDWEDGGALGALMRTLALSFARGEDGAMHLLIDGVDRSQDIRTPHISTGASRTSRHPEVRKALLDLQRRLGAAGGVVLEGRDIGTVVFPDADVKVFLTASDESRAARRHAELRKAGHEIDREQVLAEIRERDRLDSERDIAPMRPADDAVLLDTSGLTLDGVLDQLEALVKHRMS